MAKLYDTRPRSFRQLLPNPDPSSLQTMRLLLHGLQKLAVVWLLQAPLRRRLERTVTSITVRASPDPQSSTALRCWLCCTALYCTALRCTALYCAVPHCTALYRTALLAMCTALYCTALRCTALYCAAGYAALHCTALHCAV